MAIEREELQAAIRRLKAGINEVARKNPDLNIDSTLASIDKIGLSTPSKKEKIDKEDE